jgi:hypothetical protein
MTSCRGDLSHLMLRNSCLKFVYLFSCALFIKLELKNVPSLIWIVFKWSNDTQHSDIQPNDIQHNDTQYEGLFCNI